MKTKFLRTQRIKEYAHEKGRRVSPSYIYVLDAYIQTLLDKHIAQHNGGKVTLDAELAGALGVRL